MGSNRRPGKILANLGGAPMLQHVVRRMQLVGECLPQLSFQCLVATTDRAEADATESLCDALDVPCLRGSADDVLSRYLDATADLAADDLVVRATADNPIYCPQRTADLIAHHLRSGNDYTYIRNLSHGAPEVFSAAALRTAAGTTDPYCREHVTPYLRQTPGNLRVEEVAPTWRGLRPEVRLTVDTPEDVASLDRLLKAFVEPTRVPLAAAYRLADILRLREPRLAEVAR